MAVKAEGQECLGRCVQWTSKVNVSIKITILAYKQVSMCSLGLKLYAPKNA